MIAAGSILHYLDYTQHSHLEHITSLTRIDADTFVRLDRFTVRNLELFQSAAPEGKSLTDVIDKTLTPMGSRMLKKWVKFPLLNIEAITARQEGVEYFFRDTELRDRCAMILEQIGDLGRLIGRMSTRRASGRDLLTLGQSLRGAAEIKRLLLDSD